MMANLRLWIARLIGAFAGRRREARLAEEMAAHLEALAAEHEARGLAPDDARLAAGRDFGRPLAIAEAHRAQAGLPWLDAAWRDVVLAGRRLRHEPLFAAAVVTSLAVGVGGAVAVAGAVTAISQATPPFHDPASVMAIGTIGADGRRADVSWPDFQVWRAEAKTFDGLAANAGGSFTVVDAAGATARVEGAYVTANMFALLGRAPIRGRDFAPDDDRPGAAPVVLISHALRASTFAGADEIAGRTVVVNGVAATVVGVMPADVSFPLNGALWMPMVHRPGLARLGRDRRSTGVVGRLRPGVTREVALAEVTALAAREDATASPPLRGVAARPTIASFTERFLGRTTDPVPVALLAAAAMVLMIGCATATTLLFARAGFRADEIAMRAALGGSRARLVQQLLIESATYAALATVAGLVVTALALRRFAIELAGAGLPPWVRFEVDGRVAALALTAFAIAVVGGGLAPAWRLAGVGIETVPGSGRATALRSTQRWIRLLLAGEVAVTLVVLTGAAHLLAAVLTLSRTDRLVDTAGVVTARLGLDGPSYERPEQRAALYQRYVERLRGRGELDAATVVSAPPFGGTPIRQVLVDGGLDPVAIRHVVIDAGYLDTLGLRPRRGRGFTDRDGTPGQPAALVNERFVATYLTGSDALGRRLRVAASPTGSPDGRPWLPIVGVLPSIRQGGSPDPEPVVFVPITADPPVTATVMARATAGTPAADILRDELRAVDRGVALYGWQTLEHWSELSRWTQRTVGGIVAILGTLSLTLAALGIYAVTAYAAARRRKETGIRMAVGATPGDLLRLLVRGALWPSLAGLVVGAAGALALGPVLRSLVPQAGAGGLLLPVGVALVVAAVAALAAVLPARAMARTTSLDALRHD